MSIYQFLYIFKVIIEGKSIILMFKYMLSKVKNRLLDAM